MASEIVYNYKYFFYFGEDVYAFGICHILKEFIMQIGHLENIIWQRLQGTVITYKTKKASVEESAIAHK